MNGINLFGPIDMEALKNAFLIMGEGMLGIIIVLCVIALIVVVLTKITKTKGDDNEPKK